MSGTNLWSHSLEATSKLEVSTCCAPWGGAREPWAPRLSARFWWPLACRRIGPMVSAFLPVPPHCPFCVQITSFYKDTSHIGLGSPQRPHFTLITPVKTLFPNSSAFRGTEELGLPQTSFGGHGSTRERENAEDVGQGRRRGSCSLSSSRPHARGRKRGPTRGAPRTSGGRDGGLRGATSLRP